MKRIIWISLGLVAAVGLASLLAPRGDDPLPTFRPPSAQDAADTLAASPVSGSSSDRGAETRVASARPGAAEGRTYASDRDAWVASLTERASRGERVNYFEERDRREKGLPPLSASETAALAGGASGSTDGGDAAVSSDARSDPRARSFGSIEARAAQVAVDLGLIPPDQLAHRVKLAVPENSVPPEFLSEARERARMRILAEETVLENMARRSLGAAATERTLRDRRDMGRTILSGQGTANLVNQMKVAVDALDGETSN